MVTSFFKKSYLFIFGCAWSSLPRGLSVAAASRGSALACGGQASLCGGVPAAEHGLYGTWASVVAAPTL